MNGITPIQQLLLDCLHIDPTRLDRARLAALSEDGWRELFALARVQRVRPMVLERLSQTGFKGLAPADHRAKLEQQCRRIATKALTQQAELRAIVRELNASEIPVIVLKGAYLREAVYKNAALREMGDIDIMVRREHVRQAFDMLVARGYGSPTPIAVERDIALHHHVSRISKPNIAVVEVHWTLAEPNGAHAVNVNPDELWQTAEQFRLGDASGLCLSQEDLLLHLAIHAAYLHEFDFGLRGLCDMARVINAEASMDWTMLLSRADERGWSRGVELTLALVHSLLGVVVPASLHLADRVSDSVLEAAGSQLLLATPDPKLTLKRMAPLRSAMGWRSKLRYVANSLRTNDSADQWAERPRFAGAAAAPSRAWYLANRHGRQAFRLFIGSDRALVESSNRKRLIRGWLLLDPS